MKRKILTLLGILAIGSVAYASTVPIAPSVFETYLSIQQSTTDNTLTLSSNTLRDGTTLSGYVCLTVDTNTPTLEYECGTASSTSPIITGITRGIDPLTGTTSVASLKFSHRRGADVKVTDYPILTIVGRILNGLDTFDNGINIKSGNLTVASGTVSFGTSTVYNTNGFTVSTNNTTNGIYSLGNIDNYFQGIYARNSNTGSTSTTDIIVGSDANSLNPLDPNGFFGYGDFGINGSNYNSATANGGQYAGMAGALGVYLESSDGGLSIATASSTPNAFINFLTGGTLPANERLRILQNGKIGIGTTTPSDNLDVNVTSTFRQNMSLAGNKITNLGTPTANTDAATKAYADGISTAGAPISNNTTTGIARTASSTQISSGYSSTTPYFIPSSLASSTASTSPVVVVTNSNGVIDSSFVSSSTLPATSLVNAYAFGDGSDGNITISSPTTLTKDMYYNNLVVNSTLTTDGFQIFVKDTISGTGTTTWGVASNGGNASGRTGGTGAGTTSVAGPLKNVAGGGGGLGGTYGGTTAGADGGATSQSHSIGQINTFGGNGAADYSGGNGYGGGGSGAIALATSTSIKFPVFSFPVLRMVDFNDISFSKLIGSLSGNGGGGGAGYFAGNSGGGGGGGGASGGTIFIAAKNWAGSFVIYSKGGNGGTGGNPVVSQAAPGSGGGGAGGSGGTAVIVYGTKSWTGSYALTGGTGGNPGTGGTQGAAGSNGLTGISYEIPITSLTR